MASTIMENIYDSGQNYKQQLVNSVACCSASEMTYIVSSGALNSTHSRLLPAALRGWVVLQKIQLSAND